MKILEYGLSLIILLILVGIFSGGEKKEAIKKESVLEKITILKNKSGIVDIRYEFKKEDYFSNFSVNQDICKSLKHVLSQGSVVRVNVKAVFQDGWFFSTDSYGNSEPVKNLPAFDASWSGSDIEKYNCDGHPDVWRHAKIQNLWSQFRKMVAEDCKKDKYRDTYFLCW